MPIVYIHNVNIVFMISDSASNNIDYWSVKSFLAGRRPNLHISNRQTHNNVSDQVLTVSRTAELEGKEDRYLPPLPPIHNFAAIALKSLYKNWLNEHEKLT